MRRGGTAKIFPRFTKDGVAATVVLLLKPALPSAALSKAGALVKVPKFVEL